MLFTCSCCLHKHKGDLIQNTRIFFGHLNIITSIQRLIINVFQKKENIWLKSSFFFLFSKFYCILNQMIFFQTNKLKVKINLGNSLEHFKFFQKFLYIWVNSFICLKNSLEFLYLAKLSNSLKQWCFYL